MKFRGTMLFVGSSLAALAAPAMAQVPDAEVDFYVVPPEENHPFTVGDYIVLRLEVTHPADSRVELPRLEDQWADLAVINQTEPETVQNGDGTATTRKDRRVTFSPPMRSAA